MILRATAALAFLSGAAMFMGYLHWMGKGPLANPAERHLRAMKDRATAPDSLVPMSFADFVALPHGRPLAEYAALERRGASLEGYVHQMARSPDGDYYLYLVPERIQRQVDPPGITTELTPAWRRGSERWTWQNLQAALRPYRWTPWPDGPRRARVSGWLLYDFQYDEPHVPARTPRLTGGARRSARLTGWEIHPVTRIEVWDDSLGRFAEVPR